MSEDVEGWRLDCGMVIGEWRSVKLCGIDGEMKGLVIHKSSGSPEFSCDAEH